MVLILIFTSFFQELIPRKSLKKILHLSLFALAPESLELFETYRVIIAAEGALSCSMNDYLVPDVLNLVHNDHVDVQKEMIAEEGKAVIPGLMFLSANTNDLVVVAITAQGYSMTQGILVSRETNRGINQG